MGLGDASSTRLSCDPANSTSQHVNHIAQCITCQLVDVSEVSYIVGVDDTVHGLEDSS